MSNESQINPSDTEQPVGHKIRRNLITWFILFVSSLICLVVSVFFHTGFTIIDCSLGVIGLFSVPGYCLVSILFGSQNRLMILCFSTIFGIIYQVLVVFALCIISTVLPVLNFNILVFSLSFLPLLFYLFYLLLYKQKNKFSLPKIELIPSSKGSILTLVILFFVGLAIHLYVQTFSTGIHTDTALYAEIARNIVNSGTFTSHIHITSTPAYQIAYTGHDVVYFIFSLFFTISQSSYFFVKIAISVIGSLSIFPTYALAKEFFSERTAIISVVIVVFSPITILFSSFPLEGSEIIAILFFLTAFYFVVQSFKTNKILYGLIDGMLLFILFLTRNDVFYIFVFSFPLLFLLTKKGKVTLKSLVLVAITFYGWLLILREGSIINILVPLMLTYSCFLIIVYKFSDTSRSYLKPILLIISTFCICWFFVLFRAHSFPDLLINSAVETSSQSVFSGIAPFTQSISSIGGRVITIWQRIATDFSAPLLVLAVFSLINPENWRKNTVLFLFPLLYPIFLAFTDQPLTGLDHDRFFLPIYFLLSILAASTLTQIVSKLSSGQTNRILEIKIHFIDTYQKTIKLWKLKNIFAYILIFTTLLCFLYPIFENDLYVINQSDLNAQYNWQPAIDWVNQNTSNDTVLLTRKPNEWSWYTNRTCYYSGSTDMTMADMLIKIKENHVNYVIADYTFFSWHSKNAELVSLYSNPSARIYYGLNPVFISNNAPAVVIYNVTSFSYFKSASLDINNVEYWTIIKSSGAQLTLGTANNVILGENRSLEVNVNVPLGEWANVYHEFTRANDLSSGDYLKLFFNGTNTGKSFHVMFGSDFNNAYKFTVTETSVGLTEVLFEKSTAAVRGNPPSWSNITYVCIDLGTTQPRSETLYYGTFSFGSILETGVS
jgi:hypothetical protein